MGDKVKLGDAIKVLTEAASNVAIHFDKLDPADLPLLLRSFKELDDAKDQLEMLMKIIGAIHRKCSEETIPEQFESMEMDSVKIAGRNFIVSGKIRASIPADKTEKGFAWLKENGYDALIKEGVNAQSLSSAMSDLFKEKAIMPPSDAISMYVHKYTSMRKT